MRNKFRAVILIPIVAIGILLVIGSCLSISSWKQERRQEEYFEKDSVQYFLSTYEEVVRLCWNEHKQFPHIDSREYINEQAKTIHSNKKSQGLVIGGPKDSGKTTGIIFMSKAAIKVGRHVLQLNLKGAVEIMQIRTLLSDFAHKLMSIVKEININAQKCVYDNISQCQGIGQSWGVVIDSMKAIITALGIGSLVTALSNTVQFVGWKRYFALLMFLLILVWAASEISATVRYWIYFFGFSIQYRIENSDWSTAS